jgi:hypothetical protein
MRRGSGSRPEERRPCKRRCRQAQPVYLAAFALPRIMPVSGAEHDVRVAGESAGRKGRLNPGQQRVDGLHRLRAHAELRVDPRHLARVSHVACRASLEG